MHRVLEGHLYTMFCSDGHTSIRKDGKAFIRYEGEETLRAMITDEEDIHTLCVPRDGKGFTYRKNGELVMERRTGHAFERLHIDSDKMCFAFCQPVATSGGEDERISIDLPPRSEMLSCRLFSSGNEICIEGLYADEKGNIFSGIWVEGQEYMIFETGQSIAGLCSSVLVHRKSRNTSRGILYSSGNMITSQRRLQPNAKAPSLKII